MMRAYKYRIYPTIKQQKLLNKHFDGVRLIYNLALETKSWVYFTHRKSLSRFDLQVQLKELKKDCAWLNDVNSQSLQAALLHLDIAYNNFFKFGSRFPKFKKKTKKQSFLCPQKVFLRGKKLYISKFREGIDVVLHRNLVGVIKSATISKTNTGKYFASILVNTNEHLPTKVSVDKEKTVGIDLGLKTFATLSNGVVYDNPKYGKIIFDRTKILQRRFSKKKPGSSNSKKAAKKIAILHEKTKNRRKDFIHKVTNAIIKQYDTICIEDLAVLNIVKNHSLATSVHDAGWGMFISFLKYKADWNGKNILTIGRFEPSSKLHSSCGAINNELTLNDRKWTCGNCGVIVDRDLNAAINIKNFALLKHSGVERTEGLVELPTLVGTMKQENLLN